MCLTSIRRLGRLKRSESIVESTPKSTKDINWNAVSKASESLYQENTACQKNAYPAKTLTPSVVSQHITSSIHEQATEHIDPAIAGRKRRHNSSSTMLEYILNMKELLANALGKGNLGIVNHWIEFERSKEFKVTVSRLF